MNRTTNRTTNRTRPVTGLALAALVALAGCAAPALPADTAAAPAAPVATPSPLPSAACDDARVSYAPDGGFPAGSLQRTIRDRGRLVVGVSGDSKGLGSRVAGRPNDFEGFDIDLARAVARAVLGAGGEQKVQFRVITAAQRIELVNAGVEGGGVDLVARNMTTTCDRWEQVGFSATYFVARQQILVRDDATADTPAELGAAKARVCAPAGSTSIQRIAYAKDYAGIVPVQVDQHTTCLALLQQGRVQAITGDSTVLAGLAAQDPGVRVVKGLSLGEEPYGLAVAKEHPEFAAFVNAVLEDYVADGRWQRSYRQFFESALGPAQPPDPQYGRQRR